MGNVGKVAMLWRSVTVKLSDLKPWDHNPRTMTKKQAQRLLKSWQDLGQFQTIAIGPLVENGNGSKYCQVYDGHQRLSALLAAHGPDFAIDARQADRELSEDEQRELTIQANLPAGQWNWDALAGWDAGEMREWGFDDEALRAWNNDAMNLREMINADNPGVDFEEEWRGIPEFEQEDLTAFKTIKIHFNLQSDIDRFSELIGQKITDKTKYLWFPYQEPQPFLNA